MNSQELRALQEAYNQVYELDESAIGDRARNAVADQRLDAAQTDTQQSVNKLAKREKVTRASAHIAAKKVEGDVMKSSAYGPQRPKPGTTGAYRITDSFDVYDVILSHLLDGGYADTQEQAQVIMVNMSEDWRESIVEDAGIVSGLVGLALGAKGALHAAKKTKRLRDYPKNFVKGIVDPRTYIPNKKKDKGDEN